jgi:hypothetical protein
MKRLLTTLVILTGLIGSAGAVWADAQSDAVKGYKAYQAGDFTEAVKWSRKVGSMEQHILSTQGSQSPDRPLHRAL